MVIIIWSQSSVGYIGGRTELVVLFFVVRGPHISVIFVKDCLQSIYCQWRSNGSCCSMVADCSMGLCTKIIHLPVQVSVRSQPERAWRLAQEAEIYLDSVFKCVNDTHSQQARELTIRLSVFRYTSQQLYKNNLRMTDKFTGFKRNIS